MKTVLVTGGTGYIGSHIVAALCQTRRYHVTVLDDGSNSEVDRVFETLRALCGSYLSDEICRKNLCNWVEEDDSVLRNVDAVIHCAGWKSVNESVERPLDYYENNVVGSLRLFQAMRRCNVQNFVFSSSATVYGMPDACPIDESAALRPTNPYGQTKAMVEQVTRDLCFSKVMNAILLRYFNPCGCHSSGLLGETPRGVPNNLQPYVAQVASGQRPFLRVFGDDWPTDDGTPVRDYLHVCDLANAHVCALDYLLNNAQKENGLCETINLGTGKGYSVREMVKAFEKASNRPIPCVVAERRAGDVACVYADPTKAERLLGWKAEKSLDDMCADAWTFIQNRAKIND